MLANFVHFMRRTFMTVGLVFVLGGLLLAQSTTDGAIAGTVFDATGAVVAAAKIVVHNNGTNAEQTVNADASGYYRVTGLQPGTYTVSITSGGLAPHKSPQVIVQVGSVTDLSPHLGVAGATETVDVTAEAPQINTTSAEFAPTLNQTAIANLPINGGRWSNFALLTPGVVSNGSGFGLLSFRGISSLLNNNTVDGADNNQAFFSEERGRTRIGYSSPKAAVQEFQVNTSNYSAEYGRSAGGVINTVTKSGTNGIHGEGYFYDRDNVWGAANPFTVIQVPNGAGGFSPANFKPTNWRKIAGFGVGGPLIKDRLFWFLAYDWYHQNFPGTGVANNPGVFFAAPSASAIATLAGNLGVTPATATTIYNNDLNALTSVLGPAPRTGLQNIIFPKLDWIINSKNRASFSFNRMRWSSPAGIQTQATNTLGIASFGSDYVKNTWGVAKLDTLFTSNLANQVRFQYGRDFEFEFAQPPTAYEITNLVSPPGYTNPLGLPPDVFISNGALSGFDIGVPTFLQRAAFPDETRMQIADTVTWTHSKHTVKFGFDTSHVDDLSKNLRNQFGSYSYSSLVAYFTDLNKQNGCGGAQCFDSGGYVQAFGPLGFEFTTNDYAFFFQDDFRVHPRLTLSLGMRYEYQQLPKPFANLVNPAVPQTGKFPRDQNNFGPRAGFAWSATRDGKTVVRGGWGLYYGRIINSTIFNALTTTGMPGGQFNFFFSPGQPGAPVFPKIINPSTPLSSIGGGNIVFFDPHFQNPQIHQIDFTVERELGWGTVFSASYLGSLGRELPDFVDTNICTGLGTSVGNPANPSCTLAASTITYNVINGGPLPSGPYTTVLFKRASIAQARPNASFGAMTDIFSGVNSTYNALVLQLNHRMSHHIQFSLNYTRSHSIDFGQNEQTFTGTNFLLQPNNMALEKGNSQYNVPNRFVAHAIITSPWKHAGWAKWFADDWEMAPIFQVQSGLPYTLSTSGSAPGGALFGINGSGGTGRIDVLGNNSFHQSKAWVADLRLAKNFKVTERYELEVIGDFFNIANKQNITGVNKTGYTIVRGPAPGIGTSTCSNANPCLDFFNPNIATASSSTFGTTSNVNSNFQYTPRQIQLGVRVKF
jgi:hypothetical protein